MVSKRSIDSISFQHQSSTAYNYVQKKAHISSAIHVPFSCVQPFNYVTFTSLSGYKDSKALRDAPPFVFAASWICKRHSSKVSILLKTDSDVTRFYVDKSSNEKGSSGKGKTGTKKVKLSKRPKRNELRFYRLMAKKKMNSPNPEVRIRYKLGKPYDPEILTEEEKHYLKRTGEKKKHYVPVGRRGVFGGVVLNMHLHWKRHETVKVVCKPCKPGQIHEYAEELAQLSKGIVIDTKPNNTIIFYRGKNYVQPEVMSPPDTLSKAKALEKYKYLQSLEHTSHFIEKLEKELEEYHEYVSRYKKGCEDKSQSIAGT
ncbi:hypothetical protein K2173_021124 [Erythroxylum novogranatense]|uniref:CRM domain-containing protein n=1 Tax=Erythroxylum novogranatense TaxID=1862640 RepID=A0AAV8TQ15_9ROSI|nr:hypothetical protein K2173_021124 [Erythroxylum novogranatense]